MRDDERAMRDAVVAGETPRAAGARLGVAPKRIEHICEKWARQGWYAYGIVCDLGWVVGRDAM